MRSYRPVKVLLVEDSLDDIEITRRAFEKCRVPGELEIARDGREAIDLITAWNDGPAGCRPDLVLLDINLPRATGFEVLVELRAGERSQALPVVILTASAQEEDVQKSYRLGANSFIQKPVQFERFLAALDVFAAYWFDVATLPRQV
jgi:CheY-like chemotaxis protein